MIIYYKIELWVHWPLYVKVICFLKYPVGLVNN